MRIFNYLRLSEERRTGLEPAWSTLARWCIANSAISACWRFRLDLNQCFRFCRPAPSPSTTEPFEESRGLEPHTRGCRRFSKPGQLHSYFTLHALVFRPAI